MLNTIEGKNTVAAINSFGVAYTMETNIRSVEIQGNKVVIIHKPKGKRTFFKHTYEKGQQLHIYSSWLKVNLLENDFVSCDDNAFSKLDKYASKCIFKH